MMKMMMMMMMMMMEDVMGFTEWHKLRHATKVLGGLHSGRSRNLRVIFEVSDCWIPG